MKPEKKELLRDCLICFGIASLITFIVFWVKGFFTDDVGVNIQILSDGFFVSGILLSMYAGMMYISSEGALLGIGFVLRNVVLFFVPMGRTRHETYHQYRERKLEGKRDMNNPAVLIVGLVFLATAIILSAVWYTTFYNKPI